jgi:hypothetical protein
VNPRIIKTRNGAVTFKSYGVWDLGEPDAPFSELAVVVSGTGRFTGATGSISFWGNPASPTTFAGRIQGRICLATDDE